MTKKLGLAVALIGLAVPASADAQVARTWVSQAGTDANDCSYATPCLSFSRAAEGLIEGGEINAESDGNFLEFSINKSMTIDGRGHSVSITAFDDGIKVNAPGDKVTIRNLHIQGFNPGSGDGIDVVNVGHLRLNHMSIRSMGGHGVDFRSAPSPSRLTISHSEITDVGGNGIYAAPTGSGPAAKRVLVRDSEIDANGGSGIVVGSGTSNFVLVNVFESSLSDNTSVGLYVEGSKTRARIGQNVITGNGTYGLRPVSGAQIISYGNNRIFDNAVNGAPTSVVGEN